MTRFKSALLAILLLPALGTHAAAARAVQPATPGEPELRAELFAADCDAQPELEPQLISFLEDQNDCTPREKCCRVCTKGKACGNSCIRADYKCHQGKGCACNSYEICR